MIIVNNLCDFLDSHNSLSVTFVMYVFNGQNKDIFFIYLLKIKITRFPYGFRLNYYLYLTKSVYDVDTPLNYKSVSFKCHTSRPLTNLLDRMCC